MDDPSRLIELYPSVAVVKRALQQEHNALNALSFMNALYQYFGIDESVLKARPESENALLASLVEEFREKFKDAFAHLPCIPTKGSKVAFSQYPEDVKTFILQAGCACCCKLVTPFSSASKPKDSDFVLAAVSDFSRVFNRLAPLWSLSDVPALVPAMSVVLNRLMRSWDADRPMCRFLSGLMLEISAIDCYRAEFLPLSPAQRTDVSNPVVRRMFWNASFVFSHLDPKWDRRADETWIHGAIDVYLGAVANGVDLRAQLFQDTSDCIQRMFKKEEDLRRLAHAKSGFHVDDQRMFEVAIQDLKACDATLLYPPHAVLCSLTCGDNLLAFMEDDIFCFEATELPLSNAPLVPLAPVIPSTMNHSMSIARRVDSLMAANESLAEAGQLSKRSLHLELELDVNDNQESSLPEPPSTASKKKKKAAQGQRRKLAKERQMQELTAILGDICNTVAVDVVKQNERVAPTLQVDVLDEVVLAMVSELVAEMRTEIESVPLKAVMARARAQTLPVEFAQELVGVLLPGLENVLAPSVECFICYSALNFAALPMRIRYLTCCAGGSFACPGCIATHTKRHPLVAEERIVLQAVSIRRQLKIGEFGMH